MKPAPPPQRPITQRRSPRLLSLLLLACLLAAAAAALPPVPGQSAGAQGGLTAEDMAVLEQVRALTAAPQSLSVRRAPGGGRFVDLDGSQRMVVLARPGPDGGLITGCVGTVEEAAAFLSGAAPVEAEAIDPDAAALRRAVESSPALSRAALEASQTIIAINPGAGFSDNTAAAPVGGNAGATIGAQRLIAFQYAASIWASYLQSTVPIVIDAEFTAGLACGVLGAAAPQGINRDFAPSAGFPGPEHANTWYVAALANKRAGRDLAPSTGDISASFSSTLGTPGCLPGNPWYYGLDGQGPAGSVDLVSVLLHELAHGLGFYSLAQTSGQMHPDGRDDIWNYFLYDNSAGKLFKDMTAAERSRAITNTNALAWDGPALRQAASDLLIAGLDGAGRALMYAPATANPGSSVSHFDTSAAPNLLMEPFINADIGQSLDLTDELMRDIGWYPDLNYNGAPDASELDLAIALTASPSSGLTVGSALTLTLTLTSSGSLGASAVRLVDTFPDQLAVAGWTASYSGGASGPASGSGDIDATLAMPSGSAATFVVAATVVGKALSITNTAAATSVGPEIDSSGENNQASVIVYLATEHFFLPLVRR